MRKLFILFIISMFFSCSTQKKIEALKPEPTANKEIVYSNKSSLIAMPIQIELKDIEKIVNKNVTGLVYNDSILDDDKLQMKVWKTNTIILKEKNGKITAELPLKIWAKYKYGTEFLGLNDTKEFHLDGTISMSSNVLFNNFKLQTTSEIIDVQWNESPSVVIAGKNMPITYLINPALSIFKGKIAKSIDEAIEKNCDFKKQILGGLEKISEPFLANETYESWVKIIPQEVFSTQAVLKGNQITMNLGLKCQFQSMIGNKPKNTFDASKIKSVVAQKIDKNFNVSIAGVSTYENAGRIITQNFKGQTFGEGKRKITIEKVAMWQKEEKLILALDVLGSINGTIYLSGKPLYNEKTKEIYFDDLDYVLNTKGILTKSANWLLHGLILTKIKENCKYSIQSNLEEAKKNILPYFNNYSPTKGIFINGKLNDFVFEKFELAQNGIIAFINSTGSLQVAIDGIE